MPHRTLTLTLTLTERDPDCFFRGPSVLFPPFFYENRQTESFRNPANKQTDAVESITSFAEVIITQTFSGCTMSTRKAESEAPFTFRNVGP